MKIKLKYIITLCVILCCINVSINIKLKRKEFIKTDNFRNIYENPIILEFKKLISKNNDLSRTVNVALTNASWARTSENNYYPLYLNANGIETVDGYFALYSYRYQQFWNQVIKPIREKIPEIDLMWKSKPIHLYLFVTPEMQHELIEISVSEFYDYELLSLANVKYFISLKQLSHPNLKQILEPEQVKHQLWRSKTKIQKIYSLFTGNFPNKKIYIYENLQVLNRFYFATGAKAYADNWTLMEGLSQASIGDLTNSIYITGNQSNPPIDNHYSISILSIKPDKISLDIQTENNGYLVITNNYSKFWKCQVDGIELKIIPVYLTFQGIQLKTGKHSVQLEYNPWWSF